MNMPRLDMIKIRDLLRLKFDLKLKHREIAQCLNISAGLVSKYTALFNQSGLNWPLPIEMSDTQLSDTLLREITQEQNQTAFNKARSDNAPLDFEYLHQEMKKKSVTIKLLWKEYKEKNPGNAYGLSRFYDLYSNWCKCHKLTMRHQHKAGEKLFIDYSGQTQEVIDRTTGEVRRAEIFICVLGVSSYTYAEATWSQSLPDFIQSHINAFEFYNGVPELLVPDNLKSAIHKSCRYEPIENMTYAELAKHYNTAILPARPKRPKDKAKVENAVLHVERTILARLRNRQFFSLIELNQAILEILTELNNAPFQKQLGTRRSVFLELEKPVLKPLPKKPFSYVEFKKATVHIDYHIEVKNHYYSVHYTLVGKVVEVKISHHTLEIMYDGKIIATHMRDNRRGKFTTLNEHMPKNHFEHATWNPGRFLNWASSIGDETVIFVKRLIASKKHVEQSYRACLGLLNLTKRFGDVRLENACKIANTVGSNTRHSVLAILENKTDLQPIEEEEDTICNHHENIRGSDYFTE